MNPTIGFVACPQCGERATVHREGRGKAKALYYRCYDDAGAMRCGTIQPRGPAGQAWIERHLTPLDTAEQDAAADDAAVEAREDAVEAARTERRRAARRSGGLAGLARRCASAITAEDDDDE